MNKTEFIKKLRKNNIRFHEHGTRHDIYVHLPSGKKIAVPRHSEFTNKFLSIVLSEIPK